MRKVKISSHRYDGIEATGTFADDALDTVVLKIGDIDVTEWLSTHIVNNICDELIEAYNDNDVAEYDSTRDIA
jgi:hypothetical protein